MKVAEYVAEFIARRTSARVYGICGAGAMHLNDAIAHHPGIRVIPMHHEQAAAFAAEADARITGQPAVVMVTAGPGGSNTITGVACAWVDSIPMIVIAGQVTSHTMIGISGLRQLGMNELPMVQLMMPITKYAMTVVNPKTIRFTMERALFHATHGRRGPVFVEIPLDVQASEIGDPEMLERSNLMEVHINNVGAMAEQALTMFAQAERPVIFIGNGVRLSGGCELLRQMVSELNVPVISSWGAADILGSHEPHHIGHCGIFGDRASNWVIQEADLILAIGTRFSPAQIGHVSEAFAPNAKKIVVDIDKDEIFRKTTLQYSLGIVADAREFLRLFAPKVQAMDKWDGWMKYCMSLKAAYPVAVDKSSESYRLGKINAYDFVASLEKKLDDDAIIVTDVGFCFIPTFQSLQLKKDQRLIHSAGVSPMGWALPAAIGAAMAAPERQVVCLIGDGGMMLNLQELQVIKQHELPIKIFICENAGYATMKIAQNNHFKRETMAGSESNMTLPDFVEVAESFKISASEFYYSVDKLILRKKKEPSVTVICMNPNQMIAPRVQAALMADGKFASSTLDDMWPYLNEKRPFFAAKEEEESSNVVTLVSERGQEMVGSS